MRKSLFALLFPVALFAAHSASAAEPTATSPATPSSAPGALEPRAAKVQFELDARTGVALPFGSAEANVPIGDAVTLQVPIQVDVGLRPDPHLFVGAYGSYGFLVPSASACTESCSGYDLRVGIEAAYHFLPAGRFDPWVGLGAGYEWLHLAATQDGESAALTLQGFELVNVQAGLDYALGSGFKVGPFASFSLGEFENESVTYTSGERQYVSSGGIPQTGYHEWLTFGVRGSFDY